MDQLDILKEEMAALKRNLDKEQIINDKLMRTVMKQRASWLNTLVKAEFITLPFIWLILAAFSVGLHVSLWYANIFIILAVVDAAFDCRTLRIPPKIFSTYSMTEMRKFLIKQKRERAIQTWVSAPLAIIWILLFTNAMKVGDLGAFGLHIGLIGGIIGVIIAIPVIIIIYKKAQNTNDSIINDTEE